MPLPDLSRLAPRASRDGLLRDLARTLRRIGVGIAAAAPVVSAAAEVPPQQRQPIRAFHLRRMKSPAGDAMRALMFADPISADEAARAFGELVSPLVEAGLLERRAGGELVSPFVMALLDDLFVLSDDLAAGSDAVMGFGETTITLGTAAFPRKDVGRVLDLGCGAGTLALLLARRATVCVGTDLNPRAVALARINAELNGISNVTFKEGDGYAPVDGEVFDLVVSQPPFVPRPEGAAAASFLYGGRCGDELALRLLAGVEKHLAPRGRALFFVEWPDHGEGTIEDRIRAAVGPGTNECVLRAPPVSLDAHAVTYAAGLHAALGSGFEAEALRRLEHLAQAGIRALVPTLVAIERARSGEGWVAPIGVEAFSKTRIGSERIDKLFAARAISGDREALLRATLRVPAGTTFAQEQVGPGAEVESTLSARFAPEVAVTRIDMNLPLLGLVTFVHEAKSVREGIERYAETMDMPLDQALSEGVGGVAGALLHGLLEVP